MKDLQQGAAGGGVEKSDKSGVGRANRPEQKKKLRFQHAEVIEFDVEISRCSIRSHGVPIGLSSRIRKRNCYAVDAFEREREW